MARPCSTTRRSCRSRPSCSTPCRSPHDETAPTGFAGPSRGAASGPAKPVPQQPRGQARRHPRRAARHRAMSYTVSISDAVAELHRFDAIVDVRSPAEFAEDHMPGALNWPVLDDQERHDVGLLYATSPFEARKLGSALVARNIARHIETSALAMPKTWRPLVYCWRGGQRSGAMHWFLGQIGFRSRQLVGGYKAYRTQVRDDLVACPERYLWQVLCGRTGSGKTRLLQTLAAQGAQVLDLEALAASVCS
ncbi:tRNA 2-selenouridine(34) synthase MnmH, partial [Pelomonas sp. HMWF004]